jgi:hypothetical protein
MVLPMVLPPSSFVNVLKTIFDDNLVCIVDTGSELSLVEFGGVSPSTLCLKCVLLIKQGRDQVHGPCWWENTNITRNLLILL